MEHRSRGEPHGTTGGASAPCLHGYARAQAALDYGLHGTHSAVEAWPVKRLARGLHRRAVGSGI
jgi:hypothetical protein